MENRPSFDIYCMFIHRLKQRSSLDYRNKLALLAKDPSSPQMFQFAQQLSDVSKQYDTFYFSEKARDLAQIDVKELVKATEDYLSMLGGFIGDTLAASSVMPTVGKVKSINEIDDDYENSDKDDDKEDKDEKEDDDKEDKEEKDGDDDSSSDKEDDKDDDDKDTKKAIKQQVESLRTRLQFQWTTLAGQQRVIKSSDALMEIANVVFNLGIWYMGYSQSLLTTNQKEDGIEEEVRQVIYDYLLKAAGCFQFLRDKVAPKLKKSERGVDFGDSMLKALFLQALGQSQEITIGRAFKKNTSTSVICNLAVDTSKIYQEVLDSLNTIDNLFEARLEKLVVFINYKMSVYQSLAYYLAAFNQNATHKYGDAIVSGRQASFALKNATSLIDTCVSVTITRDALKGPTNYLSKILGTENTRFERENTVIGYQTIPDEVVALPDGNRLAKPREFVMPPTNSAWDEKTYALFDANKKLSESDITALKVVSPKLESTKAPAAAKESKEEEKNDYVEEAASSSSSSTATQSASNQSNAKPAKSGCIIN
ncbi:hypothetical protein SAMD00019534_096970 [Acytostelium subglobosum LB1]|uniref:hypothetical protein n=1 Tax=Acytostelium subglobosum LB1 TaxID=1410327 RepID=UPI0006448449|nr:hypothetical protein SAMD00019534_096970 [Acytostelium subglobosum LB1]GAM26522.1 hypothetical protein SAMD00019534_096970 [Acytostelium subglobosum LB1]|eukprot:XP_012750618.1 hypothetical protein SAMD00019534_096970 [Acytostelium subglobosum LB1]